MYTTLLKICLPVAVLVALSACNSEQPAPPRADAEPATSRPATEEPVPALATDTAPTVVSYGEVSGIFACGPVAGEPPFEREYVLLFEEGVVSHRSGDWTERRENYDIWEGSYSATQVSLVGEYKRGRADPNTISLAGEIDETGNIQLRGSRGERDCTWTSSGLRGSASDRIDTDG